jgi:hypothetical protein
MSLMLILCLLPECAGGLQRERADAAAFILRLNDIMAGEVDFDPKRRMSFGATGKLQTVSGESQGQKPCRPYNVQVKGMT